MHIVPLCADRLDPAQDGARKKKHGPVLGLGLLRERNRESVRREAGMRARRHVADREGALLFCWPSLIRGEYLSLECPQCANLPGFWLDLRAHEVGAVHQFIETRTAEAERSSAEHALDAAPQDHGVDRRVERGLPGRSFVIAQKLLAEVAPRLRYRRIAAARIRRLGRQSRERFDRIGPPEPPELDRGGEGDEMQPFMKKRGAEALAETAIGLVENDQAEIGGMAQIEKLLASDLARPRIEERPLVAQMQAANTTRIRQFAQQRERLRRIDALVIGDLFGNLDLGLAAGDAIDSHHDAADHCSWALCRFTPLLDSRISPQLLINQ